jgi:hypothetical protein
MRPPALAANADRDMGDFYRDLGYFIAMQGTAKPLKQRDSLDCELGFATSAEPTSSGRPATAAGRNQPSGPPAVGRDRHVNGLL